MNTFTKTSIKTDPRTELHDVLGLTGAEVSFNTLPAGASVPFVHAHKNNEEIYGVISGSGKAVIDDEEVSLTAGDWLKISPSARRRFFASEHEGITFICIQTKENSLEAYTAGDAVIF